MANELLNNAKKLVLNKHLLCITTWQKTVQKGFLFLKKLWGKMSWCHKLSRLGDSFLPSGQSLPWYPAWQGYRCDSRIFYKVCLWKRILGAENYKVAYLTIQIPLPRKLVFPSPKGSKLQMLFLPLMVSRGLWLVHSLLHSRLHLRPLGNWSALFRQ